MNVAAIEAWLQDYAGLESSSLGPGSVERAASVRMAALGCDSPDAYLARLTGDARERDTLLERIVVPETWFFRDRAALDALPQHALGVWNALHPGAVFRILSIPCSTGEEPWSLAMAFALAGWPLSRLRIDAADISRENIARARAGVYGRNSFRGADLAFRDTFFASAKADTWRIGEDLRGVVNFEAGNLLADDFPFVNGTYDAVFCRNLLIYFERPAQTRAIRVIDRLLAPDGWLAAGPAEPVLLFDHGYASLKIPNAFLLRRAPPAPAPVAPPPRRAFAPPPAPAPRPRPPAPKKTSAPPTAPKAAGTLADLHRLADSGRLVEAEALGETLLARDGASPALLFLLAIVAEAAGSAPRAEALLRKTVYLDPHHADALAHLALLADKNGDPRAARSFRQRAQRAVEKETA